MNGLPKTLPTPKKRPSNLPHSSKWLAGEGAGSWFTIEKTPAKNVFKVYRFSPKGIIECEGLFVTDSHFDLEKGYELTYPSHCAVVTVIQTTKSITLKPDQPANYEESQA